MYNATTFDPLKIKIHLISWKYETKRVTSAQSHYEDAFETTVNEDALETRHVENKEHVHYILISKRKYASTSSTVLFTKQRTTSSGHRTNVSYL